MPPKNQRYGCCTCRATRLDPRHKQKGRPPSNRSVKSTTHSVYGERLRQGVKILLVRVRHEALMSTTADLTLHKSDPRSKCANHSCLNKEMEAKQQMKVMRDLTSLMWTQQEMRSHSMTGRAKDRPKKWIGCGKTTIARDHARLLAKTLSNLCRLDSRMPFVNV